MNFTYTIRKVDTVNRIVGVIYRAPGKPDYFKNWGTDDFSKAAVDAYVQEFAPVVRAFWEAIDTQPTSEVAEGEEDVGEADLIIVEEPPVIDEAIEELIPTESYDIPTKTRVKGWTVNPLPVATVAQKHIEVLKAQKVLKEAGGTPWTSPNSTLYYIPTDIDSRARFSELIAAAREGIRQDGELIQVYDDQMEEIFIAATNNVLKTIFTETHAHLQKCTVAENIVRGLVKTARDANDITALLAVDFDTEFDKL